MDKLTLDLLVAHLGQPEKKYGAEHQWQCPLCQDSGKDNLKFNERKGVLWCFADEEHSKEILRDIFKRNKSRYPRYYKKPAKAPKPMPQVTKEQERSFLSSMHEYNANLLANTDKLDFLYEKRGLTRETARIVGLGFDRKKKIWTIPTFGYSTSDEISILGFEFRPEDLSKKGLYRIVGTPNGMALINCYTPKTEALCIVEGYFDGYALFQYLNEMGQSDYYHIVTPSNGVNSLLSYMPQIDFGKYKKYYLYIDNDDVSNAQAKKILEKYPMLQPIKMTCGCKDFNEHYLKCVKAKN